MQILKIIWCWRCKQDGRILDEKKYPLIHNFYKKSNRTKSTATRGRIINCPEQTVIGPVIPLAEPIVTKATGNGCEGAWRDKVPHL